MKFNRIANNFRGQMRSSAMNTSGIADAAAIQMGSAAPKRRVDDSFAARRQIERSRQVVGGFHESKIAHDYRKNAQGDIQKDYASRRPDYGQDQIYGANRQSSRTGGSGRQNFNAGNSNSATDGMPHPNSRPVGSSRIGSGFKEPPTRGYNPYK
jgi:hypothetical protein